MPTQSKRNSSVRRAATAVLIVEDDVGVARAVARLVPPEHHAVIVHSLAEARGAMATATVFRAAVVDIGLPDGSGVEIIQRLAERSPETNVLVLTGRLDRDLVNEVHRLGAELVCKPEFAGNLQAFFARNSEPDNNPAVDPAILDEVLDERQFTPREREILHLAMSGVPRGRLAEVMGISENTLKKQIRSLLEKTSQSSLSEALWVVRTDVEQRSA